MKIWVAILVFVVSTVAAFLMSPADQVSFILYWIVLSAICLGSYATGLALGKKPSGLPSTRE